MRHRGEYNNHVCPVCSARVKQRNAFLEHMRAHTGERPFRYFVNVTGGVFNSGVKLFLIE